MPRGSTCYDSPPFPYRGEGGLSKSLCRCLLSLANHTVQVAVKPMYGPRSSLTLASLTSQDEKLAILQPLTIPVPLA